jgi:hypothetical protein
MTTQVTVINHGPDDVIVKTKVTHTGCYPDEIVKPKMTTQRYVYEGQSVEVSEIKSEGK